MISGFLIATRQTCAREMISGSKRKFNCRIYMLSNKYCVSKRFFFADNF